MPQGSAVQSEVSYHRQQALHHKHGRKDQSLQTQLTGDSPAMHLAGLGCFVCARCSHAHGYTNTHDVKEELCGKRKESTEGGG